MSQGQNRDGPRSSVVPGIGNARAPMLLECDRRGNVIWISERVRMEIGSPATLAEIVQSRVFDEGAIFRISPLLRAREGLLLVAESEGPHAGPLTPDRATLCQVEEKLLLSYFRLQGLEQNLSRRAGRHKEGERRLAIRQIELERRRLGSELHTGIGQMLAAIRVQMEMVAAQLSAPSEPVRQALDNIAVLAVSALDQVRSISRRLHPPEWQRLTIDAALRQLWELSGIPLRFSASLSLSRLPRDPDPEIKILIYRAAQEGLSNIAGHSRAQHVSLSLAPIDGRLVLMLKDDGMGFDTAALARAPANIASGIGLRSISELAATMESKFTVESGPNGTTLVLSTPYSLDAP